MIKVKNEEFMRRQDFNLADFQDDNTPGHGGDDFEDED
jgi:hypothetical protein